MHYRRGHFVRSRRGGGGGIGILVLPLLVGVCMCINKVEQGVGCGKADQASAPPARIKSQVPAVVRDRWMDLADLFKGQSTSWLLARADLALKTSPVTEDSIHEAYLALGSVSDSDRRRPDVRRLERRTDAMSAALTARAR